MRCISAALIVPLGTTALALSSACGRQPEAATCPQVTSPYAASDVVLRLKPFDDPLASYRLPLGKVVEAPAQCSFGSALELLTAKSAPSGSAPVNAFKAVHLGRAHLASSPACPGETCVKGFDADITVTDGCQIRPRADVIRLVTTPMSYPQGQPLPAPRSAAAKLTTAARYAHVFQVQVDLQPETLVWAVLVDEPLQPEQDPALHVWAAFGVDACTDWHSFAGSARTVPAGWESIVDLSSQ